VATAALLVALFAANEQATALVGPVPIPTADVANAQSVFVYLVGNGFTSVQASAVIGNLVVESNINPAAGQGNPWQGVAQWSGGRWQAIVALATSQQVSPYTLIVQQQFIVTELKANDYNAAFSTSAACLTDVDCATAAIQNLWEQPSDPTATLPQRQAYAEWALANLSPPPVTPVALNSPAVGVTTTGTQYVFWKGKDGGLWQGTVAGASPQITAVTNRGASPLGSPPSAGVDGNGVTYVYWQGMDGGLWEMYWTGVGWSSARTFLGAGHLGSPPSVAVTAGGIQYVFWKGLDGQLWEGTVNGSSPDIMAVAGRGGAPLNSPPSAGVDGNGVTYVYWQAGDNSLWEAYWAGTAWSRPRPFSATQRLGSPPAVTVTPSGIQYVFWRGVDGDLWQGTVTTSSPAMTAISDRGGGPLGSTPSAGIDGTGATYVYWQGPDGALDEEYWTGTGWSAVRNFPPAFPLG
jgi:Phage tail lysozyme